MPIAQAIARFAGKERDGARDGRPLGVGELLPIPATVARCVALQVRPQRAELGQGILHHPLPRPLVRSVAQDASQVGQAEEVPPAPVIDDLGVEHLPRGDAQYQVLPIVHRLTHRAAGGPQPSERAIHRRGLQLLWTREPPTDRRPDGTEQPASAGRSLCGGGLGLFPLGRALLKVGPKRPPHSSRNRLVDDGGLVAVSLVQDIAGLEHPRMI